jgi:hypothetical protein
MKFIQVSILSLASLVVMSAAKAAIQDRVPAGSAAILQWGEANANDSLMEIRQQTTHICS